MRFDEFGSFNFKSFIYNVNRTPLASRFDAIQAQKSGRDSGRKTVTENTKETFRSSRRTLTRRLSAIVIVNLGARNQRPRTC
jgi:hypothetical protein